MCENYREEYKDEYMILAASFDHAIDGLSEDIKRDALEILRYILGREASEKDYLFPVATGFCMGIKEGFRLWDAIKAGDNKEDEKQDPPPVEGA